MNGNGDGDEEYRTRTGLEPPTFAAGTVLGNIGGVVSSLDNGDDEVPERDGGVADAKEAEAGSLNVSGTVVENGVADLKIVTKV